MNLAPLGVSQEPSKAQLFALSEYFQRQQAVFAFHRHCQQLTMRRLHPFRHEFIPIAGNSDEITYLVNQRRQVQIRLNEFACIPSHFVFRCIAGALLLMGSLVSCKPTEIQPEPDRVFVMGCSCPVYDANDYLWPVIYKNWGHDKTDKDRIRFYGDSTATESFEWIKLDQD
ncbi:hypothetical protein [Spirosoma sp.]|uniref:hypothetical protein n=1 Tax=Spirosoma sp. TaxID=1899569 RepID=UPI003B3AB1E9